MGTYNWQERRSEDILRWILPSAITRAEESGGVPDQRRGLIDVLRERTKDFTEVELSIVVNGIEMDGSWLLPEIERQYNQLVEQNTLSRDDRDYIARELRSVLEDVLPMLEGPDGP